MLGSAWRCRNSCASCGARRTHSGLHAPNHHGVQWVLADCRQYIPNLVPLLGTAFERFTIIMSVALVWLYAIFLISVPYPFRWGAPTYDIGEAFVMMSASFVALVESTGAFIAVSRYASTTPCPPSVMSRGIGWQGVGILLGGLFGTAYGSSVSVENAGLLGLTRVGSRRVVQISAGFMIFSLYSW
uniref:Uncharacterized protein n=1 Tax=Oryza meridionalis TaxID=40149 RepID=A0A0E0EBJ4_9ORYZ